MNEAQEAADSVDRFRTRAPTVIHWSADDWNTVRDVMTHDVGLGIHIADLMSQRLPEDTQVKFTFYWPDTGHWESADFSVRVGSFHADGDRDGTASAKRSATDEK